MQLTVADWLYSEISNRNFGRTEGELWKVFWIAGINAQAVSWSSFSQKPYPTQSL
jgi:hypothetical protein